MSDNKQPEPKKLIPCRHCNGTGQVECQCDDHQLRTVADHPCNVSDHSSPYSSSGFVVKQCRDCGRVWGLEYQWDAGTGSDDKVTDYGFGDPFELVKKEKS